MRNLLFAVLIALPGCQCKKQPPPEVPVEEPAPVKAQPKTQEEAVKAILENFTQVHFEFDSAMLAGESQRVLSENARILQQYPDLRVEIQGHADERGTTEYNLALGEKRAKAVKDYVSKMGVSDTRLTLVTFGEEKPENSSSNETAWAQNRRAEFRVLSGPGNVTGTVQ